LANSGTGRESGTRAIEKRDPVWIPLRDGTRLAATIWLPKDATERPVPALLEYLPYRRRDGTVDRDSGTHAWFATQGYASVRVDIRGTGDSDGLLADEYLPQEQADAVEVIDWLARQDWCSGRVGMFGISWGGFNALQVAALRPPALRAIITLCSTDDRYTDDCHFMGGCLLNNSLAWASTMFQYVAQPPDPAIVADWRKVWRARIENLSLFAEPWLSHQHRDAYWRQGSVNEDYGAIEAAVYVVGGWADAYSNAIPRLVSHLKAPSKALIGPWGHAYPHVATPAPDFDFLNEAKRWWDHWLKDIDTGIMAEDPIHAWLDHGSRPSAVSGERQGTWLALRSWPDASLQARRLHLGTGGLAAAPQPKAELLVNSPIETGVAFGEWCPYGALGELPADQRPDDGRAVSLDSDVLSDAFDLVGAPVIRLRLACDQPSANLAVRLNDIFPDGASTQVTYGVLNLAHRNGSADPKPMPPGRFEEITLKLNDVGYRFAPGHRIRVAISNAFFPTIWPAPAIANLRIDTAGSSIDLPQPTPGQVVPLRRRFDPPFAGLPEGVVAEPGRGRTRIVKEDPFTQTITVEALRADSRYRVIETGTELHHQGGETYEVRAEDPLSAETRTWGTWVTKRGDWSIRTETRLRVQSQKESFILTASIEAFEDETPFARRDFAATIPRNLV
jgi:putative CocE/NonD family hydrolase